MTIYMHYICFCAQNKTKQWLPIVKDYLDVYTYHNYDDSGADPDLATKIVTPQYLDSTYNRIKSVLEVFNKNANPSTELWVGEIAAAWHSGQVKFNFI